MAQENLPQFDARSLFSERGSAPPRRSFHPPAPAGRTPRPVRTSACSVSHVFNNTQATEPSRPRPASGATLSRSGAGCDVVMVRGLRERIDLWREIE